MISLGFGNRKITWKAGLHCARAETTATTTKGAPPGAPFALLTVISAARLAQAAARELWRVQAEAVLATGESDAQAESYFHMALQVVWKQELLQRIHCSQETGSDRRPVRMVRMTQTRPVARQPFRIERPPKFVSLASRHAPEGRAG